MDRELTQQTDWRTIGDDYPHEISLFGSTQQVLAELTQGLEPGVKHALLAGNAMRVYGLTDDVAESHSLQDGVTLATSHV